MSFVKLPPGFFNEWKDMFSRVFDPSHAPVVAEVSINSAYKDTGFIGSDSTFKFHEHIKTSDNKEISIGDKDLYVNVIVKPVQNTSWTIGITEFVLKKIFFFLQPRKSSPKQSVGKSGWGKEGLTEEILSRSLPILGAQGHDKDKKSSLPSLLFAGAKEGQMIEYQIDGRRVRLFLKQENFPGNFENCFETLEEIFRMQLEAGDVIPYLFPEDKPQEIHLIGKRILGEDAKEYKNGNLELVSEETVKHFDDLTRKDCTGIELLRKPIETKDSVIFELGFPGIKSTDDVKLLIDGNFILISGTRSLFGGELITHYFFEEETERPIENCQFEFLGGGVARLTLSFNPSQFS